VTGANRVTRSVLIIGSGVVGTALAGILKKQGETVEQWSARKLLACGPDLRGPELGKFDTIVHAGGPAGEAACLADPAGAFAAHYTLTQRLVEAVRRAEANARLVLLGTLAPDVGFYGPLKWAACAMAEAAADRGWRLTGWRLMLLDCGQIVGPGIPLGRGVLGEFLRNALRGYPISVQGDGSQTILATPLRALAELIAESKEETELRIAPVTRAVSVSEVARLCLGIAERLRPDAPRRSHVRQVFGPRPPSYMDPDAWVPTPIPDLGALLEEWASWALANGEA